MKERGKLQSGGIVIDEPVDSPDGTEVFLHIEPVEETKEVTNGDDFEKLLFFGMWAERDEINDGADWVRREREKCRSASRSSASRMIPDLEVVRPY